MAPPFDGGRVMRRASTKGERNRLTRDEMATLDDALVALVHRYHPIGVRGTFYRAESRGLLPKLESEVERVQRRLLHLRRVGRIPYYMIVDDSREVYGGGGYADLGALADDVGWLYRKDYWALG
jgi:hypothetical protein